ncbi:hypothetical protein IP81_16965 [Novosphingobium sp. AAP83]|nr:hypothetical protein IP81_16965 [Novosphingobium sp. AAP83]
MSLRALQRRTAKLEKAGKPRPSLIVVWYGSFDAWIEQTVLPVVESGALDGEDMIVVVAALREWESSVFAR